MVNPFPQLAKYWILNLSDHNRCYGTHFRTDEVSGLQIWYLRVFEHKTSPMACRTDTSFRHSSTSLERTVCGHHHHIRRLFQSHNVEFYACSVPLIESAVPTSTSLKCSMMSSPLMNFGKYLRFFITAAANTPIFYSSIRPSTTQKPLSKTTYLPVFP